LVEDSPKSRIIFNFGLYFSWLILVTASLFAAINLIDYRFPQIDNPDPLRVEHVKSIKAALEKYRTERGSYPHPYPVAYLSDLKPLLVDTGYLKSIPTMSAPSFGGPGREYLYVSDDGTVYGILVQIGSDTCVTGDGVTGRGWWSNAPECSF
jgi:hypothetical protein